MSMKNFIYWNITPCGPFKVNRRFGGIFLLATCFHSSFLLDLFFGPEDGGDVFIRNVGLHGIVSYKIELFLKTSESLF
jgi:hypothetical protein